MDAKQPWYQLLFHDFWGTPLVDSGSHGSYRPLCVLSYKVNHIISGFKPFGYHLVNVLLHRQALKTVIRNIKIFNNLLFHSIATGLVVKLARHIIPYGIGGLISGLLFATMPVHTEGKAVHFNLKTWTLILYTCIKPWPESLDVRICWRAVFIY